MLDNAGFHVGHNAAQIVSGWLRGQAAYLVFTPVYSPEFNAAELVFNYLKTMLKDSRVQNLALQSLKATVYGFLSGISPQNMLLFIRQLVYVHYNFDSVKKSSSDLNSKITGIKSKWTINMSFHVQNHMY